MKHKATVTITFETCNEKDWEQILEFKKMINSGELQRGLSYRSQADRDNPKVSPTIKVKATYIED